MASPEEVKQKTLAFLRGQNLAVPLVALEDEDGRGARLVERSSGKSLSLRWDEVDDAVEKTSPLRPAPYFVLVFKEGRQVALADVGFAFAPSTRSTGPLPDLPDTFCFRDYRHLFGGAEALIAEEGREKEAISAILLAIALLDGARACGFEVSGEERSLDALLRRLEARGLRI